MSMREQKPKDIQKLLLLSRTNWLIGTVKGLLLTGVPRLVHILDLVLSLTEMQKDMNLGVLRFTDRGAGEVSLGSQYLPGEVLPGQMSQLY